MASTEDDRAGTVAIRIDGPTAWLTLNRPEKRNAVNEHMLAEIIDACDALRADPNVGVVVVGAEGSVFSAGIDLHSELAVTEPATTPFEGVAAMQRMHTLVQAISGLPQVTIAAIQGNAVGGGGFGVAMACDLRYAVKDASFWMVPTSIHEVQDFGLTWLLQRMAGDAKTLEWVLTGHRITADEAHSHGLVQHVVADADELTTCVRERAAAMTSTTPDVIKLQKLLLQHGRSSTLDAQLDLEVLASALCFQTDEFAGAMKAIRSRLGR